MTSQYLPPSNSYPLLVLDFKKLFGYYPNTLEEADKMKHQVCRDIFDSDASAIISTGSVFLSIAADGDSCSYFIQCTKELFDMGMAYHLDSAEIKSTIMNNLEKVIVTYPEYLETQDNSTPVMKTAQIWKEINQGHPLPIVERILLLLCQCSRDLLWKYYMSTEIRKLAYEEGQRKELQIWRTEQRPAYLEKLYQVRETFNLRLSFIQNKYDEIVQAREIQVQKELDRRYNPWEDGGSDLDSHTSDESEDDDNINTNTSGHNIHDTDEQRSILPTINPKPLPVSEKKLEEDIVRNQYISEEERICLTLLTNLEKRLDEIDHLLESLQEEQWTDDEEALYNKDDDDEEALYNKDETVEGVTSNLSILDQILAMILGSIHCSEENSLQNHYTYIRHEHETIVQGWKDYFGRLPYSSTSTRNSTMYREFHELDETLEDVNKDEKSTLKIEPNRCIETNTSTTLLSHDEKKDVLNKLGIFENEWDDWEDVDGWDAILRPTELKEDTSHIFKDPMNHETSKPRIGGVGNLRPGGSVTFLSH